jgi:hypothetical protein
MTQEQAIAKLVASFKSEGFTKEQAAQEMSQNNTDFEVAVKVLSAI